MTITSFQMLCNKIGPLVSQVLPSHSTNSHYFLMHMEESTQQMCFHLSLFALILFSHKLKTSPSERKNFFCELRNLTFPSLVSDAILQMCIKIG